MLTLGDSCKYSASIGEGFDCTRAAVSNCLQPHIKTLSSEWQVTVKLHLVKGCIVASELMYFYCTVESGGRL